MAVGFSQALGPYSSFPQTININTDVNIAVVVVKVAGSGSTLPAVYIGGVAMSSVITSTQDNVKVGIYQLVNPPTGSQSITQSGMFSILTRWGFYGLSGADTVNAPYTSGQNSVSSGLMTSFTLALGAENRAVISVFGNNYGDDYTAIGWVGDTDLWINSGRSGSAYGLASGNLQVTSVRPFNATQMVSAGAAYASAAGVGISFRAYVVGG